MLGWLGRHPNTPHPILDQAFLARLVKHLGRPVVAELLADGLIELTDRLGRLEHDLQAGDRDAVLCICHDIAGVAGHLGLTRLSIAAADVNRLARSDPDQPIDALVAEVLAAGPDSCAALRQEIAAAALE